ncbi:MAG TPA: hypothetical protein VF269_08895 [Rhodanobacteraceae bacterium]
MFASLATLCFFGFVAATLALACKRIPEGQVYTLHRRHQAEPQLLTPGTHWIVPLRDRIAHKISLTGRALRLDETLDDGCRAQGTVYWQVLDPERADAVIDHAETLVREHTLEGLRSETTPDAIVRSVHIKNQLNDALRPQGMLVTRVDVHTIGMADAA